MTFMVYLLSQHPDILSRLRAEVLENVGPSAVPTYDNIRNMKYLRAVINGVWSYILQSHYGTECFCNRNNEALPGRVSSSLDRFSSIYLNLLSMLGSPFNAQYVPDFIVLFTIFMHLISESINEGVWPSPDPQQKPIYIPANTR